MTTPPASKSIKQLIDSIKASTEKLGLQTHAGAAMLVAAALDRLLEDALATKMVSLNREMRDKLFGEYGSLRNFSAKIDVAFAFGLVDRENFKLLTAVRKCRNLFAHTNGLLSFESPEVHAVLASKAASPTTVRTVDDFISVAEAIEMHVSQAAGMPMSGIVGKLKADL